MNITTADNIYLAHFIAKLAHKGQVDKAGNPYILHPEYVASKFNSSSEYEYKIVAYLHDVVEDTDITTAQIARLFNSRVANAVDLLTRKDGQNYFEYINNIRDSKNMIAIKVKIEDLKHNSDMSRIPNPTNKDMERLKKYKKAINILSEEE